MLTLEMEFLLGVAFAARGKDRDEPDWPPQPDRVFSALTAAWGARGERSDERAALEWLERQSPPRIAAGGYFGRPAPTTFVPPNDAESGRVGNREVAPALRRRQPRRFPAAILEDPLVHYVWEEAEADGKALGVLNALAQDTPYVGHSASLTRCRFLAETEFDRNLAPARRRVYPGRLAEIETAYQAGRRPALGEWMNRSRDIGKVARSCFGNDWLVLEIVAGDADLRAGPALCKALLKAIMSGYGGAPIPPIVSGHDPDGAKTASPHLAVLPLANVGWTWSDGALFGFALAPPRRPSDLMRDPEFRRAVRSILRPVAPGEKHVLKLNGTGLMLSPAAEGARASLDSDRYVHAADRWATATPLVLDRHLKADSAEGRQVEIEALVAEACVNIGLPAPVRVVADKHSAIVGAPSAYPSGRAPPWTGWRTPAVLRSRPLTHAVIDFGQRVAGPVILGAGRFCGLGLCLPTDAGARE
ncbi:MAG TPA: type I-U CRISPR-associated protein Csb2 [Caulobacteraceae bacterium]|nr:type I-U CRISPR-associated protein Csb2 [Caulobacteraceae bacterium]